MSKVSPYYLPQINAPVDEITKKLTEEGIDYEYIKINPNELIPSQIFALSDGVNEAVLDDMHPIWIDNENNICDGHHKYIKALNKNILITAVKIDRNFKDTCRILNKIEDLYDYEQARNLEEVEMQDAINSNNEIDSGTSDSEFLRSMEEDNSSIQSETPSVNPQTVIAYRKEPIKQNSVVGNFFTLEPIEGYTKYQIDFDNLLDTHVLGITYKDGQQPAEILSKIWFPHINFEELSKQHNMPVINLKNKANAEKAMSLGFDGIKFGDTLIQGLK